jgi:hypothetical protein
MTKAHTGPHAAAVWATVASRPCDGASGVWDPAAVCSCQAAAGAAGTQAENAVAVAIEIGDVAAQVSRVARRQPAAANHMLSHRQSL